MIMDTRYRTRVFIQVMKRFLLMQWQFRSLWLKFNLPFEAINIMISLFSSIYFARTFGGQSALLAPYGGDFFAYLITGMMIVPLLMHGIQAYFGSYTHLLEGTIGVRGQSLSTLDYVLLSGSPPTAAVMGIVLDGYIRALVTGLIYLLVGLLLGFRPNPGASYTLAIFILLLGIVATTGIGLVSASLVIILRTWRGIDPVSWFFMVLGNLFSGAYFPVEILPSSIRIFSYVIPQTYVLRVFRVSLNNPSATPELYGQILFLIAYSAVWLLAGYLMMRRSNAMLREKPMIE
jgi:ABC-2 type transport system permease protein